MLGLEKRVPLSKSDNKLFALLRIVEITVNDWNNEKFKSN